MQGETHRPLVRRHIWVLFAYGIANLGILLLLHPFRNADWDSTWRLLATWDQAGQLYEHLWRYSPAMLPLMGLIVAAGPLPFALAHLLALLPLSRLGVLGIFAFSAFVWTDIYVGNFFTFVLVAAAFTVAGSRSGALAYLTLTLLMPRPVQIPLALWALWRLPDTRLPFAGIFVLHAIIVVVSGHGPEWLLSLAGSASEIGASYTIGPGKLVGAWWLLVGVPVAVALVATRSPRASAVAGLVASPYLLPQYLGMALLAVVPTRRSAAGDPPGVGPAARWQGALNRWLSRLRLAGGG